jgi:Pyruvate/2-oxoacid:ferredoxin oxidoreductase delta subunit
MSYRTPPKPGLATFDSLHLWYHAQAHRRGQGTLDIQRRSATFDEVLGGFDAAAATYEAQRCLSCGNCFECDGCYSACPEDAIVKLGPGRRYEYDFDKCTGCAICYDQCPCGAIEMIADVGA